MKFMARILIAMLVIAMMCCVVGCNGNDNDAGTNDVENVGTNNVVDTNPKQEEIIDDYYVPDAENLVGIALYPVDDKNDYPYACGEKVTNFSDWKFVYQIDENTYAYDDNVVDRFNGGGRYVSNKEYYWGYVYESNESYYIVATHDYCDLQDSNFDRREVNGYQLYGYVVDVVPDACVFEFSWYDLITVEVKQSTVYENYNIPEEIIMPDKYLCNYLYIKEMHNGEIITVSAAIKNVVSYKEVKEFGGTMQLALNGYKNGESYQYYIDFIHPDFQ